MRNLAKTLAVVSLLAPSGGYSLGIGDIKLHSALNQNLDAEISLAVSSGEKASEIKVSLAPPDKFDEAGVPWTSLLSKIKFITVVDNNGFVVIKLSSREAIKEPFLNFLLEVSWSKGSLYREFTVLLDPPALYNQATLPVLTTAEGYETEQTAITQRQSKQREKISADLSLSGEREYVPTRRNDTLWIIAERASRREGVSVEQMMIAMYEENPRAFYKENIHALSAGKTLKIPEKDIVLKFSRKQALAEFNRQTNAWKNRESTTPIETSTTKIVKPDNQLTLVAPTEADVSDKVILTPENEQVSAQKKADHDVVSKTIDKEVVSIVPPVNDLLQDKVVELEKQLAMMQQILALKNQQLAALQNQSEPKPVVQSEFVQTPPQGQAGTVNPIAQQKAVPSKVKPTIRPEPEAGSIINTHYLWAGGIGAGTLPFFGWLWWRKRRLEVQINNQSPIVPSSISKISESQRYFSTATAKESDSTNNLDIGDKGAFFNELTFGDLNTFDMDQGEIDPISEADVYLAYGRYQQAEELMRDVIRAQPGRDDFKLKLLEIYHSNKNSHAFEAYTAEIAKAGKKDDVEFWTKVTKMSREICQDSKLFPADDFASKENAILEKMNGNLVESYKIEKNELTDFKRSVLGLSSFTESFDNENHTEIPQITDRTLDFNLISSKDEVIDEQQNNEGTDFYLSTISTKTKELSDSLGSFVSETLDVKVNDESFDFDFDTNESAVKGIDEIDLITDNKSVNNYELKNSLSDKLSGLNSCFSSDSFNRNIYFDRSILGLNDEGFDQKDGLEVVDLANMDELKTKLDLAKAYIDISDTEATKDMACEVFEKGTAEKKDNS